MPLVHGTRAAGPLHATPKTPSRSSHLVRPHRRIVVSSMTAAPGFVRLLRHAAEMTGCPLLHPPRHGTCNRIVTVEKNSRPMPESVNSSVSVAKPRLGSDARLGRSDIGGRARRTSRCDWHRGAAEDGCRKRTHVREACGGAIRFRGVGINLSHGHPGRSVGRFRSSSFVVQRLPDGHPSLRSPIFRGPGLLAALTTRDVGFVRMPAPAGRTASATRRRSPVVNRAVPIPATTVGTSGGWMGRTRTGPRTRLRRP